MSSFHATHSLLLALFCLLTNFLWHWLIKVLCHFYAFLFVDSDVIKIRNQGITIILNTNSSITYTIISFFFPLQASNSPHPSSSILHPAPNNLKFQISNFKKLHTAHFSLFTSHFSLFTFHFSASTKKIPSYENV